MKYSANLLLLLSFSVLTACTRQLPFQPEVLIYEGNRAVATYAFEGNELRSDSAGTWNVKIEKAKQKDHATDYALTFTMKEGKIPSGGVAVEFSIPEWSTENYLFAPAAMYNGNRFRILPVGYPPFIYNPKDRPLDMPVTTTNVPHLSLDGTEGKIELMTNSCATPLVGYYDKSAKRGFFLLTQQDTILGNSSFTIHEIPERRQLTIAMRSPGVREHHYTMCNADRPSNDKGIPMEGGQQIKMSFRIYDFPCSSLMAYFDKFLSIRKALSGENEYRNLEPFSSVANTLFEHHFRDNWFENDEFGYVCNKPNGDVHYGHLQLGWNGVPAYSLMQLMDRDPDRREENLRRIARTFESIKYMQGKSGLFYGIMMRGELIGDNFGEAFQERDVAMIRRTGMAIYYTLQCLDFMKEEGIAIDPSWEEMCRKAADGLVNLFGRYGEFGQMIKAETGEIYTPNSTQSALCMAALAYASKYFGEPRYMELAEKAGQYYYEKHLSQGYVGGGPAEILQAPDSESSAELCESYTALYELTGDEKWLRYACDAAAYLSTWVVSYDYRFPDASRMRQMGTKAAGSVWASIQNEHSAPGIYVLSGDCLLKLYRATGDRRYVELLKDIAHNVVQYVHTEGNPIQPHGDNGYVTERVNIGDWEGEENIGGVMDRDSNHAWENVTLFHIIETPGIYVSTDTGEIWVFDHVKAKVTARDENELTLEIENPTYRDASVAVMAESTDEARRNPMGWNAFRTWKRVEVPSGQTVTITLPCKE